ncbi:methyltransferase family protein [Roseimicrobium gellanilyticum]|uniref:Methyltransferase family protein n=1 Tax=Roseimicrobium gellanilyticum TaxID=748857 RepID=A0A366HVU8_9BACT|nr:class I SAM-dependent methyltransferase [Roseimicrobium gellanilyticum]RBP48040.1 methyltransferase family protein [Roseimicrobium gellanilyticum]
MFGKISSKPADDKRPRPDEADKLANLKVQRDKAAQQRDRAREKIASLQSHLGHLEPVATAGWKKFACYEDYWEDQRLHKAEYEAERAFEAALWARRDSFGTSARCGVCRADAVFEVDSQWADERGPAWREKMQCRTCGLNTRLRAALQFLLNVAPPHTKPKIYATEQVTAFFQQLKQAYPDAMGSEYLSDGTSKGSESAQGIRHEDVTSLTFEDESFDALLTFEVLEHVPDWGAAIREFARVLKPGGLFWASFPFDLAATKMLVRATVSPLGEIIHHQPPEYHGDPINADGCLCYQVFGWDVMDALRGAGLVHLDVYSVWNPSLGLIGRGLHFVAGRKAF